MKTIKTEIDQKVNLLCLKETIADIEVAIKSMNNVTSMGNPDKHEDRDMILRVLSDLNQQSRNIQEAISKVNQ
tara:strand:+ start:266 stop:484 length:219 start_codon:yes stop_codon:yes gene_type:complete